MIFRIISSINGQSKANVLQNQSLNNISNSNTVEIISYKMVADRDVSWNQFFTNINNSYTVSPNNSVRVDAKGFLSDWFLIAHFNNSLISFV